MPGGRGERNPAVYLREARILDVDPINYLVKVQFVRGEEPSEAVAMCAPYLGNLGGGWMGAMPEEGDFVLVAKATWAESYRVIAHYSLSRVEDEEADGAATPTHGYNEPRQDYSAGRGPTAPGDMGLFGAAGNRMAVRRSGVVEVVADELTFTRYFPNEKKIRSVCKTMELMGYFGLSKWYTLRDAGREAEGATPTGYMSWVKNHVEGAPLVNVELGAVLEDEAIRLPGLEKRDNSTRGSVVARFLVFDQQTANIYGAHSELPPSRLARMAFWADQEGNIQWLTSGQRTETMLNLVQHIRGRETRRIEGGSATEVIGDHTITSRGSVNVVGDRSLNFETGGDFTVRCGRFVVAETNGDRTVEGNYRVSAGRKMVLEGLASLQMRSAGEVTLEAGRGRGDVVGGRYSMRVLNNADPENLGRDVAAYDLKVSRGKHRTVVEAGSYEVVLGPDLPGVPPVARIKIFNDPRLPQQVGRIHIGFPLQRTGITLGPDGSFELTSATASISGDAVGNIQLGKKGVPVAGKVISTASYPVDFVTGLPIPGHQDVLVSPGIITAGSPVTAGIGAGAGPFVPPTIDPPDEPAA